MGKRLAFPVSWNITCSKFCDTIAKSFPKGFLLKKGLLEPGIFALRRQRPFGVKPKIENPWFSYFQLDHQPVPVLAVFFWTILFFFPQVLSFFQKERPWWGRRDIYSSLPTCVFDRHRLRLCQTIELESPAPRAGMLDHCRALAHLCETQQYCFFFLFKERRA